MLLVFALTVTLLVISLLIAALRGMWHYWHRGTPLTHTTIKALSVISVLLLALSFLFVHERRSLLIAAFGVGPFAILLHMTWTWLKYQGPPQDFEQLPKPLEEFDGVVTDLGQQTARVALEKDKREPQDES